MLPLPTESETPLVSLCDVTKSYRGGLVLGLDRVSLDVRPGESLAVMGKSGCGKSTLLNMLGALDRPTSGEIYFRGQKLSLIHSLDKLRARHIGFVFQAFYLLPNLTAEENVQLPMFESELPPRQRRAEARRLLQLVGLEDRLSHLPDQLSNGQRQRVAIARALANSPSLILADEPTGALDSERGQEILELLLDLNKQQSTTLVIVTHDAMIASATHRILHMCDGRLEKVVD